MDELGPEDVAAEQALDLAEEPEDEGSYKNPEATAASNSWLEKTGSKISRWIGHGLGFVGPELVLNWGTGLATLGTLGTILSGNPLPLVLTAGGSALAASGAAAEWDLGMKNAESPTEKKVFWLSKIGQTVGTSAFTMLALLGSPVSLPIATGMYLAGVGMGLRAMTHRK
jgi:hypothetical protein